LFKLIFEFIEFKKSLFGFAHVFFNLLAIYIIV